MRENRNSPIFKLPSQFNKVGATNSFNFNDGFPSVSLFAEKLNFSSMIVTIKRMKIMTATRFERTTTQFVNEHSTIYPNWPNE